MDIPSYRPSLIERINVKVFDVVNKVVPWHRLPGFLGAFNLVALRVSLRSNNLHDGYASTETQGNSLDDPLTDERFLHARNSDGKFNSLDMPRMGCAGMRFGRQFPREHCKKPTERELWTPNPRMISERFMARRAQGFIPATGLNLLAAAWIQFQTHDWFSHQKSNDSFDIPLSPGDAWPQGHMKLAKTKTDDILDPSDFETPGYRNENTSWWDASQVYGSSEAATHMLRAQHPDGKLAMSEDGMLGTLPHDATGIPTTGFYDNWWLGLEMLHSLFVLEHNAICDMLREAHPNWSGDKLFDTARLVNCALMAKIHTVEWTPAVLAHPALKIGMKANWWGLAGETLTKLVGRISKTSESVSGIPGSGVDYFGVPYSLTEEFVSVYRMHSLIPDNVAFFKAASGNHHSTVPTEEMIFSKARKPFDAGLGLDDACYSFGINYAGAITNNNYPEFLRRLRTPDGQFRDMGTVDILRDRERGVPRYNQFRRLLGMSTPKTFEELTGGNKELAQELREAYDDDIEAVDTLVGSHSEPLPKGFGFSETAFRVFIVMASGRLKSDRFFADQWNEETYSKEGLRWVQHTTMKDVLVRHCPELGRVLKKGTKNVFAPWDKLPKSTSYGGVETNA
ncbi:peroxidase domain-containing protein [Hirsutella rhossiliensis]|uniref:Peroxidase domain-containing protein n=1 Tax=Hirsutella rhossiliensis TaxID=111463 RepID=A0A9P8MYS4_9HYPO|nr:peroxidase domain-containing protein [Hirsutella rhossiliensis]KAH0963735.1 peroxidase domain-containing protein [Hirsutella rhossiliensis]